MQVAAHQLLEPRFPHGDSLTRAAFSCPAAGLVVAARRARVAWLTRLVARTWAIMGEGKQSGRSPEGAAVPIGEAIRRARFAAAGEDQANRTNNHGVVVVPPT